MRRKLILLAGFVMVAACSGQTNSGPDQQAAAGAGGSSTSGGKAPACCTAGEPAETPDEGGAPAGEGGSPTTVSVGGFKNVPASGVWEVAPGCVVAAAAAEPEGPFASPAVVWLRVSRFVFDEETAPMAPLPEETTPAWASGVALEAFDAAQQRPGGPPGIKRFLVSWLQLEGSPIFEQDWGKLVGGNTDVLKVLLTTPLVESGRVGIFAEVPFLTAHPSITGRGAALRWAWFRQTVPKSPEDVPPVVPGLGQTRRAALEEAVSKADCGPCHELGDSLGVSLEHFDELGRYRELDAGASVDSSGILKDISELDAGPVGFEDIAELAGQVAPLCTTAVAFANACYGDALSAAHIKGAKPSAADEGLIGLSFLVGGRRYRSLVASIAQSGVFLR